MHRIILLRDGPRLTLTPSMWLSGKRHREAKSSEQVAVRDLESSVLCASCASVVISYASEDGLEK